jgi:apolipoprotein N-acyltransferase
VELSIEVRDLQQPRPYSPEFVGFGQPFFVGFGFLIGAVLLLFLWMGLRFYVVNNLI